VTKAYDTLRKGKTKGKAHLGADLFTDAAEGKMSARRRRELRARAELRVGDDEKWRERLMVGALFVVSSAVIHLHEQNYPLKLPQVMVVFVYRTFETRREGLALAAAANSRANGNRRPFEATFASHPSPDTSVRNKQTIEDEKRLAAQDR
jgi:hypothetical protein